MITATPPQFERLAPAPPAAAAAAPRTGVALAASGVLLLLAAAAASKPLLQRLLLGADAAKDLAWGPALFRSMLALHGLLTLAAGVFLLRRSRVAARALPSSPLRFPESPSLSRNVIIVLLLMLLAALALRLWKLGEGIWYDELLTLVLFVRPPVGEILISFPNQNQHMLYSLLAHTSVSIFGEHTAALRLPAALFGVASIWSLFMLVRHLAGVREALLACALMTLSYHHVWFSQNARGYSAVLFFATTACWLWLYALPRRSYRLWLAFAVTVAFGMWAHMTMAFVAAAMGLSYLFLLARSIYTGNGDGDALGSRWLPLAALVLSGTLTLQLYALGLPEFLSHGLHETSNDSEWTNPLWLITETIKGLHIGFAGSVILVAGACVLAAGAWSLLRRNWVALFIAVVPAVVLCTTMIVLKHNLWPRFVFFAAGFGIFFVIRGVFESSRLAAGLLRKPTLAPAIATAGCAVIIAASASTLPRCYYPKQDYGAARDFVRSQLGPHDAAIAVGMAGRAYQMYFAAEWPWVKTQQQLDDVRRDRANVWLVYTTPIHMKAWFPELWDDVQRDFTLVKQFPGTLGGGTVYVCRQTLSAPAAATTVSTGQR